MKNEGDLRDHRKIFQEYQEFREMTSEALENKSCLIVTTWGNIILEAWKLILVFKQGKSI